MSKKNWLLIQLLLATGGATSWFAYWLYKRLKRGKFDKLLTEAEKKNLMETIEEFLKVEK